MHHKKGFTTAELMVTVCILSVLSAIAMQSMTQQLAKYESRRIMVEVAAVLKQASSEAMGLHRRQVVCFSANQADCVASGYRQLISFADLNKNGRRERHEPINQILPLQLKRGHLKLSAGLGRRGFVFMADTGRPRGTQGNVTYCADNGDMQLARSLIISKQGRIRHSYDYNSDGVHDRRSRNDPVQC